MEQVFDHLASSLTSYSIAGVGLVSQQNVMFTLGALLLLVRLIYDVVRLIRYIKDPKHAAPTSS